MKITKLFAAVIVIAFGTIFISCNNDSKAVSTTSDSTAKTSNMNFNGQIAFVRMDSLMRGYGMYIDMSDDFAQKGQRIEGELTQKGRALEREVAEYQDKAQKGLITRFEGQTIEDGLQKKNQAAMQYRDKMMAEMQQEEIVMSNKISTAVLEFLKQYNEQKHYSVILQTSGGNPVILADPTLDITEEVLAELNKRYLEAKSTEKKSTPAK